MVSSRKTISGIAGVGMYTYAATVAGLLCCGSPLAYAQEATAGDQAGADNGVEEIIVSSRRREEKLQSIPVTVSVVSAKTIEDEDITSIDDIAKMTPGFSMEDTGARIFNKPTTRGTSVNEASDWNQQKTKIYVDGVIYTGNFSSMPFTELDRVEVIKGPQTTAFGRGALAGAVDYVTKNPTDFFSGIVSAEERTNDETHLDAFLSGPIVPGILKAYVNLDYFNYRGPNSAQWKDDSPLSGERLGNETSRDAATKFVLTPNDTLTVSLRGYFGYDKDGFPTFQYLNPALRNGNFSTPTSLINSGGVPTLAYVGTVTAPNSVYSSPSDEMIHHGIRKETDRFTLEADQDLGFATLTSTTAYNHSHETDDYPGDEGLISDETEQNPYNAPFGSVPQANDYGQLPIIDEFYRDWQQELRLTSNAEGPFQWMVGGDYFNYLQKEYFPQFGPFWTVSTTESYSGFVSLSYKLFDDLTLGAEARYNFDKITTIDFVYGTNTPYHGDFRRPLPRFTANYQVTPDVMIYGIVSEGNAPGQFNADANLAAAYPNLVNVKEEILWNYEAGVKSSWFENRLIANVAFYHIDWTNMQLNEIIDVPNLQYNPSLPLTQTNGLKYIPDQIITNAGGAKINGVEVELAGKPIEQLELHGTMAYDDATYTSFCSPQAWLLNPTPVPAGYNPATYIGCLSVAGKTLFQQPPWSASMQATYTAPLIDNWDWYASAEWTYVGIKYGSETNINWTPPSEIVNLHAGVTGVGVRFDLFVMNATQETAPIRTRLTTGVGQTGSTSQYGQLLNDVVPQKPRQFGVKATYSWGAPAGATEATAAAYVPPPVVAPAPAKTARSYMVFFDFNKSDLSPQAVAIVDQAASNAAPAKATELTVTGHTDTVGSDAYNMRLSRRRAESVAAELEKQGIPSSEIEIVAKGKHDLLVPTGDGVREPQNRRVTIVYGGGATS